MTLTSHGHHIPGTTKDDEPVIRDVHRCGGPNLCHQCSDECIKETHRLQKLREDADNPPKPEPQSDIQRELSRLIEDVQSSRLLYAEGRLTYSQIEDRLRLILAQCS